MSNAAMNYVDQKADKTMPSGMFFVLFRLADRGTDHSREDWTCFPSIEQLQEDTRLSRSAVERHLQALVADGWISRKRRVRPDGKLGIYDYWIHRSDDRRAALRDARQAIRDAGEKPAETLADLDHPCCKTLPGPCSETPLGPCSELPGAMRRFDEEPCGKSPQQEPSGEPSREPTSGARAGPTGDDGKREPGDRGFEAAFAAWPTSGQARTSLPKARSAWARAAGVVEAAQLLTAVARYATEDHDLRRGDHGAPGFHTWLADERWRAWLPKGSPGSVAPAGPTWTGPAELRAAIVQARSEGFAVSYLDRATFEAEARVVRPRTTAAATELGKLSAVFREFGASVGALQGRAQ